MGIGFEFKGTWIGESAYDAIFSGLKANTGLSYISLDQQGPSLSQSDEGYNYSTYPISLNRAFDFFIDGRRRLGCAFVAGVSQP